MKYASKAEDAGNFEDIRNNSKEAAEAFEDAKKYADRCGCKKAEKEAANGYKYAKKAYKAANIQEAKEYAEDARESAEDLKSAAENCDRN